MPDVWGRLKMPKSNPIDLMQIKFLKQVLGVQTQTTGNGVILVTGSVTFDHLCKKDKLVPVSCKNALNNDLVWPSKITLNFETVGLYNFF